MRRHGVSDKIESMDGCEVTVQGQRESAGQVYYEIGVQTDSPREAGDELKEFVDGTDWQVRVYEDEGGRPFWYDHDEEEEYPSDIRMKKNLYNEHMI